MRKLITLLIATFLALPASAQTGPKYGKSGGIGSSNTTYQDGEPFGGTYSINGATGNIATAGNIVVSGSGAAKTVTLSGSAGQVKATRFQTGGINRWVLGTSSDAESGGDAGSTLTFSRFSDGGGFLSIPLSLSRSDGSAIFTGTVSQSTPAISDVSLGSVAPGNILKLGAGSRIAYCPELSCVPITTGGIIHHSASALFSTSSLYDAQAQEDTVAISTVFDKSYKTPMARSTAYVIGANAYVGNAVYRATTNGTTASGSPPPGVRPASFPFTYADGGVTWLWVNDFFAAAKTGIYNECILKSGGGASWCQAHNYQMQAGATPSDNINTELDFSNNSGTDCAVGSTNCNGLLIVMGGTNSTTAAINVNGGNGVLPGVGTANWGMRLNGTWLRDALAIDSTALRGVGFGTLLPATFSIGTIDDHATAPASYIASGTNSVASILLNGSGPNALSVSGAYSFAITATGFTVDNTGNTITTSVKLAGNAVSGLGVCNSSNKYQIKAVGDASSPTWNAVLTGGGATAVLALCNGSAWVAH